MGSLAGSLSVARWDARNPFECLNGGSAGDGGSERALSLSASRFQQLSRRETAALVRSRPPIGQPEFAAASDPAPDAGLPAIELIRQLAVADPWISESRARFCLFPWICFLSRLPWDTLRSRLGHRSVRQEPRVNLVVVDATRAALAGNDTALDKIPQMARHGALGQPSERGELPHGREAAPGTVGEADQALHCPSEPGLQRTVDVKGDGNKGKHGASGCAAPARKRLILGALCR